MIASRRDGEHDAPHEYQHRTYEEMRSELRYHVLRACVLIPLMYNRLTLVDELSHDQAFSKLKSDFEDILSVRTLYRYLPENNPYVPHRNKRKGIQKSKTARLSEVITVTDEAWMDPREPNVIQDRDKVIIIKDRFQWVLEKIEHESQPRIDKIIHDLEKKYAFYEGMFYGIFGQRIKEEPEGAG